MQKYKAKSQGNTEKKLEGLDIEKICELYADIVTAYNKGKDQTVSNDIYKNYVTYVSRLREQFKNMK